MWYLLTLTSRSITYACTEMKTIYAAHLMFLAEHALDVRQKEPELDHAQRVLACLVRAVVVVVCEHRL